MSVNVRRDLVVALIGLALLLVWDLGAGDLWLIRPYADEEGFALRDHWFTRTVLHDGGRLLGYAMLAALLVNVWRPWTCKLTRAERWHWVGVTLLCVLLVPSLKQFSPSSCPWDLRQFGSVATHLSHWRWTEPDGGPGRCFPSGHATAAFAFFSGYFALRHAYPGAARWWLAAVVIAGIAFGWGQMARGAHFASHTMWTAWLCWALCAACFALLAPRAHAAP